MENASFAPLLIVVGLAFIVPLLLNRLKRLRLPVVVGEILAGVIIGHSGLGWVDSNDPLLIFLAEFGFVFLMFLSGMEIDFSNIGSFVQPGNRKPSPANHEPDPVESKFASYTSPVALGTISFALTLALSITFGFLLVTFGQVRNPWMAALILSTTSLGVVLPVLKEKGLTAGRFGQTLLIAALVADFATMLLITVLVAALSRGLTLDVLLVGLLFVAFFTVYRLGLLFSNRLPGLLRILDELSHATSQIKVRAAFTIMLLFIVLSEVLGAEVILGSFLAGAVIALLRTPGDEELSEKLESFGFGFFIPIFFLKVGIDFNFQTLLASPKSLALVPELLIAAVLVKFIPTIIFRRAFSWRESLAGGALLSSRLSLIIAASAIGLRLGVISDTFNAAIILVAILTVTFAPIAFTQLLPVQKTSQKDQPIVIAGANDLGLRVALNLIRHQERTVMLDPDPLRLARARQLKIPIAYGLGSGEVTGEAASLISTCRALICTHNDPEENFKICHLARTQFGVDHIVAQVNWASEFHRFEALGVKTMNAAMDSATLLVLMTRSPAMYELLSRTDDNKEIIEILVTNPLVVGKTLRQLNLPGDVLILAMRRSGELLVPHGNTHIEADDLVTLVGSLDDMPTARAMFSG